MLLTTFYVSFFRIYLCSPWLDFGCQDTRLLLYGKLVPRKLGDSANVFCLYIYITRKITIYAP